MSGGDALGRLKIFALILAVVSAAAVVAFWTVLAPRVDMYYEYIHVTVYRFVSLPLLVFSLVLLACLSLKVRVYDRPQRRRMGAFAVVVGALYALAVGCTLLGVRPPAVIVYLMSATSTWLPPLIGAVLGAAAGLVAKR